MTEGLSAPASTSHQEFPCQSCGAKLQFKPGTTHLTCDYCGAVQDIGQQSSSAPVRERSLEDALRELAQRPASELAQGGHEIQCNGCGAVTLVTGQAAACPFCDSPMIVPIEEDRATIVPESLLPFHIEAKQAAQIFADWIKSRWFAPNDLSERAKKAKIDGVYLPYYTYDTTTVSSYQGERGTHYYVTETYTDSEGNTQTRQVRKTRWNSVRGSVRVHFDDVLICASKSLPVKLTDTLEPWDLQSLRSFDPAFLSGFMAERATLGLEQGFGVAKDKMDPRIRSAIRSDIGGDEQRIHSKSTNYRDPTFKLFLLPLWLSSFRYKEKVFRFVINARTGEPAGERPYSAVKIALAVIAGILLVAAIVLILSATEG